MTTELVKPFEPNSLGHMNTLSGSVIEIRVSETESWSLGIELICQDQAEVIIPVSAFDQMSDEQIGRIAREAGLIAKKCLAEQKALCWLEVQEYNRRHRSPSLSARIRYFERDMTDRTFQTTYGGLSGIAISKGLPLSSFVSERLTIKSDLLPFAGDSDVIRECLNEIEIDLDALSKIQNKEDKKLKKIPGYVYLIQSPTGHYKIGKSKTPEIRHKEIGLLLPFEIKLVHTIKCEGYSQAEKLLHQRYASKRTNGEWFNLSVDDVSSILAIKEL